MDRDLYVTEVRKRVHMNAEERAEILYLSEGGATIGEIALQVNRPYKTVQKCLLYLKKHGSIDPLNQGPLLRPEAITFIKELFRKRPGYTIDQHYTQFIRRVRYVCFRTFEKKVLELGLWTLPAPGAADPPPPDQVASHSSVFDAKAEAFIRNDLELSPDMSICYLHARFTKAVGPVAYHVFRAKAKELGYKVPRVDNNESIAFIRASFAEHPEYTMGQQHMRFVKEMRVIGFDLFRQNAHRLGLQAAGDNEDPQPLTEPEATTFIQKNLQRYPDYPSTWHFAQFIREVREVTYQRFILTARRLGQFRRFVRQDLSTDSQAVSFLQTSFAEHPEYTLDQQHAHFVKGLREVGFRRFEQTVRTLGLRATAGDEDAPPLTDSKDIAFIRASYRNYPAEPLSFHHLRFIQAIRAVSYRQFRITVIHLDVGKFCRQRLAENIEAAAFIRTSFEEHPDYTLALQHLHFVKTLKGVRFHRFKRAVRELGLRAATDRQLPAPLTEPEAVALVQASFSQHPRRPISWHHLNFVRTGRDVTYWNFRATAMQLGLFTPPTMRSLPNQLSTEYVDTSDDEAGAELDEEDADDLTDDEDLDEATNDADIIEMEEEELGTWTDPPDAATESDTVSSDSNDEDSDESDTPQQTRRPATRHASAMAERGTQARRSASNTNMTPEAMVQRRSPGKATASRASLLQTLTAPSAKGGGSASAKAPTLAKVGSILSEAASQFIQPRPYLGIPSPSSNGPQGQGSAAARIGPGPSCTISTPRQHPGPSSQPTRSNGKQGPTHNVTASSTRSKATLSIPPLETTPTVQLTSKSSKKRKRKARPNASGIVKPATTTQADTQIAPASKPIQANPPAQQPGKKRKRKSKRRDNEPVKVTTAAPPNIQAPTPQNNPPVNPPAQQPGKKRKRKSKRRDNEPVKVTTTAPPNTQAPTPQSNPPVNPPAQQSGKESKQKLQPSGGGPVKPIPVAHQATPGKPTNESPAQVSNPQSSVEGNIAAGPSGEKESSRNCARRR
ncbi:hypothetical protein IWQ60_007508 [Tieghemiomyces parasiticus]|uniref:Uncharacterized protein n=1 Tax=Tieghemiomyces parasiticus TaxID=78921 RepID=A0A9W7ZXV4_9FUNG|nr:hypothetical protein IWQ60_007508 [Tieghemiomyces parasiticus]